MRGFVHGAAAAVILLSPFGAALTAQDTRADSQKELAELFAEQRYEELLRRLEPGLVAAPEAAPVWMMAAETTLKLEDYARSITCFEQALALSPALRPASINLGFAYVKADRLDDAQRTFEPFLKDRRPSHASKAHYGIGLVQIARGDSTKAAEAFEQAATLDPSDVRPVYRLGQMHLQAGRHERAIGGFRAVLEKDELHHGAAYGLARAYALAGREAEAKAAAEAHHAILEASDAVTAMVKRLGEARDPVAARIAIADRLFDAGARRAAAAWFLKAERIDPMAARKLWRHAGAVAAGDETRPASRAR